MKRRITQIISLILLHSSWGPELKWFCNPVLSCHSCALSWFACPVGVFIHYSGYHVFPFIALGTILLLGSLFGRLLCGWVCPFGLVQDLLHKIPTPKFGVPQWTSSLKYLVLALMVFLIPFLLGEATLYSFCRVCPAATLQVTIPILITGGFKTADLATFIRLALLGATVLLVIFSSRLFCKILCPIGALLGPLNYLSLWVIKVPAEPCISCHQCDKTCSMDGKPSARIIQQVPANRLSDCIVCHECRSVCPRKESKRT